MTRSSRPPPHPAPARPSPSNARAPACVKPPMHPTTQIDLAPRVRDKVGPLLAARLADAQDLHSQAKQAHWTVRGPHFKQLHELFDAVAEEAEDAADLLAERLQQFALPVAGTLRAAAARTSLPEYPLDIVDGARHVQALAAAVAAFGGAVRRNIDEAAAAGDAGTADLFTEISRAADKSLWMIEAHRPA